MLGGSLATLLSGRYIEINVLPLSFSGYVSADKSGASVQRLYGRYISNGSMPATMDFAENALDLHDYLKGILNTVLLKDVAQRLNISNTFGLGTLCEFLFDDVGNQTSVKRISDLVSSQGTKISANTVAEYLSALTSAFIFYPVKRYDVRGGRLLKLQEKYYAVDMGMRRCALTGSVRDGGRILENVVFLELKRRYADVFVGKVGDLEVDFVARAPEGPVYYQVAETAANEKPSNASLNRSRRFATIIPKSR